MVISLCVPLFIGMLPLPGSSTFDLEEELEELHKKLQITEGEQKWTVKFNFVVKLNQECF